MNYFVLLYRVFIMCVYTSVDIGNRIWVESDCINLFEERVVRKNTKVVFWYSIGVSHVK